MNNVGIICDFSYTRHHLFRSYYYAVENLFGTPRIINSTEALAGIKLLFIGDPHFIPHREVWQRFGFIPYCNANNIKVVALNNEKILNSFFPWNVENLKVLNTFKHLYHYTTDVDDCDSLGLKLNRSTMSRHFQSIIPTEPKKDKIVFIGVLDCPMNSYSTRKAFLREMQKTIKIDIVDAVEKWEDYLRIIAGYRFVLSPLGNGNLFSMRFYEILSVKSIPVHQVKENTLDWYDVERGYSDCIFFKELSELKDKLGKFSLKESRNMIWMEDNIEKLLAEWN